MDDSDADFVDIKEIKTIDEGEDQDRNDISKTPLIHINDVPVANSQLRTNVQRSETTRSSMKKSPLLAPNEGTGKKRAISFDLHDPRPSVSIQSPSDEPLRNLFSSSRWSSSSSDSSLSKESSKLIANQQDVDVANSTPQHTKKQAAEETKTFATASQRSKSLVPGSSRQRSVDVIQKRRHSAGDGDVKKQTAVLRDSAIDLISDEENSEAYAAISLAGTLRRNAQPVRDRGINRKHVIIGAVSGSIVAITIILILIILLVKKA